MKIKVIDLLNKIANREIIPFKLKSGSTIYYFSEYHQDYVIDLSKDVIDTNVYFIKDLVGTNELNDEVEVLEEDKEIEELKYKIDLTNLSYNEDWLRCCILDNKNKINELIKAVNELKKGK